ncbi:MAG: hypothetical protein JEZ14_26425, partial [Marinilabiliaceae bacterium]|nr:hypothetical protein [Marinilabiliaceae bacterium]
MKKYYFIALTGLIFSITTVFGQLKNFDLKKYKQPELNRLTLDFNFSQYNNSSVPAHDSKEEQKGIKRQSSFSFNGGGGFSWYRNSTRYQGSTQTDFQYTPQIDKVKFDDNEIKDSKLKQHSFGYGLTTNNYFYSNNNWFFSPNLKFHYNNN